MNYQCLALGIALEQRLRRAGFWLAALFILAAALAFRWEVRQSPDRAPVTVGVSLSGSYGEPLWQALEARNSAVLRFVQAEEAVIREKVASSQWDCGLLFPENFASRLENLDLEGSVTLITGPGSAVYPLVRETVSAVLAQLASPILAEDYIRGIGIPFQPRDEQQTDFRQVSIILETLEGRPFDQWELADAGASQILLGCTAAALLLWTLFTAMDLGRWKNSPAARRLRPCMGTPALLLPRLLAALLPSFCLGALGLLTALGPEALPGIGMLLPYLAMLGALALLLALTRRVWRLLPALLPFAAASTLVLSPVFLDITLLFPRLSPLVRWLPATLYLVGCRGTASAPWTLLGMAAGFGTLAAVWERLSLRAGSRKKA